MFSVVTPPSVKRADESMPGPATWRVGDVLTSLVALAYVVWMLVASCAWIGQTYPGFLVLRTAEVATTSREHWNGLKGGLRVNDRIVAVDGRPVAKGPEVYRIVADARAGTAFTFTYERPGVVGRQTVTVPSAVMTQEDWVALSLTSWLLGATHLILGIFVLFIAPRDTGARALFLFCLAGGIVGTSLFNTNTDFTLNDLPIDVAAALVSVTLLNLALLMPRRLSRIVDHPGWPYVLGVGALVWVLASMVLTGGLGQGAASQAMLIVGDFLVLVFYVACLVWARWSGTGTPRERAQAGVILLGLIFGLLPVITTLLFSVIHVHVPGADYASLSGVLFPLAIAYTIVRHKLFEIEVIVKRTVMYAVVTTTLVSGYFLLIAATRALIGGHTEASNVLATAVIAICFAPLRDLTKRYVDHAFFRSPFDFERLVTNFGREARTVHDARPLFEGLFDHLEGALHPSFMVVLVRAEGSEELLSAANRGDAPPLTQSLALVKGHVGPVDVAMGLAPEVLTFPLVCNDEALGYVLIGPRKSGRGYSGPDRLLLVNMIQIASGVLGNLQMFNELGRRAAELARMNQELAIASAIQTALVPTACHLDGFDMALEQLAATEVGGDLVDYVALPDGEFWLAMGDVTGHGLNAGLVMMMAQSIFTTLATHSPGRTPAEMLTRVNRTLYQSVQHRLKQDIFMTLQLVRHHGDGRFSASGLHCDILIYRALTGVVESVETSGTWVGLMSEIGDLTTDSHFELGEQDVMLLYTDGLLEARNAQGEQFDVQRLEQALVRHAGLSSGAIKQRIMDEVRGWMHLQDDDVTMLVLKRLLL